MYFTRSYQLHDILNVLAYNLLKVSACFSRALKDEMKLFFHTVQTIIPLSCGLHRCRN
jgi:hypothetical protein